MSTPSTEWKERFEPDEARRYAEAGRRLVEIQRGRSARFGIGRALHRKQRLALRGTLTVRDGLPEFARQGLFADPGAHDAWVRLSNGGMDKASDRAPDVRGFAIKVFGVSGRSALSEGPARSQDFLLINHSKFAFASSAEFVDFVVAAARGQGALLGHLLKRYGVIGGTLRLARMVKTIAKSFKGFACEPLFSAAPIACGPYAVRVRLEPMADNGPPDSAARDDWGTDVARRLLLHPLRWALQLQPYSDERRTPIEDASVDWPTPYTTVATLEVPMQAVDEAFADEVEVARFDPWQALAAHRPLGDVMRARKVVYFASQQERGAQ